MVTALEKRHGVVAAVMAAVNAYLEEEERARLAAAPGPRPIAPVNMWRVFGRQEAMRARSLRRRRAL